MEPRHLLTRTAVDAVYGLPLDGLDVVAVPADLAPLLADAHRRVTGRVAGVHAGDGTIDAVTGPAPEPALDDLDAVVAALERAAAPVVLAGPGVVRDGAVEGLRAVAAAGSVGVLNTWGAKGLFDWRSPHHLATAGLQAHDFELGGLATADLILATGVDEAEALAGWRLAPAVEVPPASLAALAERWRRPTRDIAVPPLRAELARVTQEGWSIEHAPLPPSRATLHHSDVLGAGGLVAADAGVAGFWVARTFPTATLGGALVPAPRTPGFAAAAAVVAKLLDPTRPVLAVVSHGEVTERVLEVAAQLGVRVAVEVWDPAGEVLDAADHRDGLHRLVHDGGTRTVATDPAWLTRMVDVAGPVVAWGGLGDEDLAS